MKKLIINLIVVVLFFSGCQSVRTALKFDPHVKSHSIVKNIEDKHMVHVFVEHKWSKEMQGHYINVSGYVRDPHTKSFLHDIGLFKKDPDNAGKSLEYAFVEASFLDKKGQVVDTKRVKVERKYVLHGSHRHRSKFSFRTNDEEKISQCKLKIVWS